jgi:aconitate hydratase
VIAESFERIHRSNLVGMGVLPLQFADGESRKTLGLDGSEEFAVHGLESGLTPGQEIEVTARKADGSERTFTTVARVLNQTEVAYLEHGGVLNLVLRQLLQK